VEHSTPDRFHLNCVAEGEEDRLDFVGGERRAGSRRVHDGVIVAATVVPRVGVVVTRPREQSVLRSSVFLQKLKSIKEGDGTLKVSSLGDGTGKLKGLS